MCNHHEKPKGAGRHGAALSDGEAHARDHQNWTRRQFLSRVGAASLGAAMTLGGLPVRAFGGNRLLDRLSLLQTDRVLVLVQLSGGNDGLNTIIPITNDIYYTNRKNIGIKAADALALNTDYAMHKSLAGLQAAWGSGEMAILHSVGYPSPNLSHFRSTDIWLSSSSSNDFWETGWLGRALDHEYPEYKNNPTAYPLAVQIGSTSSMLFKGPDAAMGLAVSNPDEFYKIVNGTALYDEKDVPANLYGGELAYIRSVANDSVAYAAALKTANAAVKNTATFPTTTLGSSLGIVSRMIRGGLGARIYQVSISGFDTHSGQLSTQSNLLLQLGDAIKAFTDDLNANGWGDKVLTMTFSEFGRRVKENGSLGTDHGTAAPMLLFGKGLKGGFYGEGPNLANLDSAGNLQYSTDFRAVYGTILANWFDIPIPETLAILGLPSFSVLDFLPPQVATDVAPDELPGAFSIAQNYPNPFSGSTTIQYVLNRPTRAAVKVYDLNGRLISKLMDQFQMPGTYQLPFHADFLPSGTYIYRLETSYGTQSRQMTHIR